MIIASYVIAAVLGYYLGVLVGHWDARCDARDP